MRNQNDLMRAADQRSGDSTAPKDGPVAITPLSFEFERLSVRASDMLLPSPNKYLLAIFFGALSALTLFAVSSADAQNWRIPTPRDTVFVPANQRTSTGSRMSLTVGVGVSLRLTGTFGLWQGQNSAGFDARYTYDVPGWAAPFPLLDPPSFNGTNYQIFMTVSTNYGLTEDSLKVFETNYQPSHDYTARYLSTGVPLRFRIKDRLNERPDGYYYGFGTGGINIELARFTSGIAIQSENVNFGTVLLGSSASLVDSIASYGVDPLMIDSVKIFGSPNFSFTSQRSDHFTLPTEQTNSFQIKYSPGAKTNDSAEMHIYSHNADLTNRERIVHLSGLGGAPTLSVVTKVLDLGMVRVNTNGVGYISIYNGGNANLNITGDLITPGGYFSAIPSIQPNSPVSVTPGANWQLRINFLPLAKQKYRAMLYIRADNVALDSVLLLGEGVEPEPVLSATLLNFGSVRRGDRVTRYVTLFNGGNLTASITSALLGGPNHSAYYFEPSDSSFLLNADSSITFAITFAPGTGPAGQRHAWLDLNYDDHSNQRVVLDGYEVEPVLSLARNFIDFGKVKVGSKKADTLGLINASNTTVYLPTPYIIKQTAPFTVVRSPTGIGPAQSDNIALSFRPYLHGPTSAWLHTEANGQYDSVYLLGYGALPRASLSLDTLDFGILPANLSSTMYTTLSNVGDFPLVISRLDIAGPDAKDFAVAGTTLARPFSIDTAGSQNLAVTFVTSAKTGLKHVAWMVIIYDDSTRDSVCLLAQEQSQFVQFSQRLIDFGKVLVNTSAKRNGGFSNGSNKTLTVGNISVTAVPPVFTVSDTSSTVRPRDTSQFTITFSPTVRGSFTGFVKARDGDIKPDSVTLIGVGAAPVPVFSDSVIDFGDIVMPGTKSAPLTLTNTGDWILRCKISIVNDRYNEFSFSTPGGSSNIDSVLDGGGQSVYNVTFTPKVPQLLHTADMRFDFEDGSIRLIKLRGQDEYPFLVIDSVQLNFGKVRVGKTAAQSVNILNTSIKNLTADNVALAPAGPPFTSSLTGKVTVAPKSAQKIDITFSPTARGVFTTNLIGQGGSIQNDTLAITGIGAQAVPVLSIPTLDYGQLYIGSPGQMSTTLSNQGDWDLHVVNVSCAGPNTADFDCGTIIKDFIVQQGQSTPITINYLATTPYQNTPRLSSIIFTMDDSSKLTLNLIAQDKNPLLTPVEFDQYLARPGDIVRAKLRLKAAIPAANNVQELKGSITFDTTIAQLQLLEKGALTAGPEWLLTVSTSKTGPMERIDFTLKSATAALTVPGQLLHLDFLASKTAKLGARTDLATTASYPGKVEVAATSVSGGIIIDSTCGAAHLESGSADATFVQQNTPNPFGASTGTGGSDIHFDVGATNTVITLRILDVTGKEIARPLDKTIFDRGRYYVTLNAHELGSGTFFYEFITDGAKPVIKKMIVRE
ncbi:MAG: choice-of-anchor D domain-containing protein [Candidatus Kapaibacterium sp.]